MECDTIRVHLQFLTVPEQPPFGGGDEPFKNIPKTTLD